MRFPSLRTLAGLKSKFSILKQKLKQKLKGERRYSHIERMLSGHVVFLDNVTPSRFSYLSVVMESSDEIEEDDWIEEMDVDFFWSLDGHLVENWFNA